MIIPLVNIADVGISLLRFIVSHLGTLWDDLNVSIFWSWCPSDIQLVLETVWDVMVVLAMIALIKRILSFFLGFLGA